MKKKQSIPQPMVACRQHCSSTSPTHIHPPTQGALTLKSTITPPLTPVLPKHNNLTNPTTSGHRQAGPSA
jgi:hypothetical protein